MTHTFRILSLNCKNEIMTIPFDQHSLKLRMERILSYLDAMQPLCAGLQEFTSSMHASLAPRLSYYQIFGENRYQTSNRLNEQTAILINTHLAELEEAKTIWLSTSKENFTRLRSSVMPRTCTVGKIRIKETSQRFYLLNVHLDVVLPYTRYKQAAILLEIINDMMNIERLPVILVGDFNAHYESKVIQLLRKNQHPYPFNLRDIYVNTPLASMTTIHHFKSKFKQTSPIDYIFISDEINVHHFSIVQDHALPLSDHFPVFAELSIK